MTEDWDVFVFLCACVLRNDVVSRVLEPIKVGGGGAGGGRDAPLPALSS
jgi:hypothetical protein